MVHYLERHTYTYFDFNDIKPNNTFFAPGTTPGLVLADVEAAITMLRMQYATETMPMQGQLGMQINGKWVQVGWRPVAGQRFIGQFFPGSGPGIENISKVVMEAIAKVVGP